MCLFAGLCAAGFYCSGGSPFRTPSNASYGNACSTGEYCPEGAVRAVPCVGGYYCADISGVPTNPCDAGYFCRQGASSRTPQGETNNGGLVGASHTPLLLQLLPCPLLLLLLLLLLLALLAV